jgi:hypothetical protein
MPTGPPRAFRRHRRRRQFALGETRYDSGERIGTFLAVASTPTGRMARYGGALAGDRLRIGLWITGATDFVAVADG